MDGIKAIVYSPEWRNALMDFLKQEYPKRKMNYFEWWLANLDRGPQYCRDKSFLVFDGAKIIGCTSANSAFLSYKGETKEVFWRGNTIVDSNYRGRGISRLMYEEIGKCTNWFSAGITDIAWKIQPKLVKTFSPMPPVRVYIFVCNTIIRAAVFRLFNIKFNSTYPIKVSINKTDSLSIIDNFEEITIPNDGFWLGNEVEFSRDRRFLENRFINIYRPDSYVKYILKHEGKVAGYLVVRMTELFGLSVMSLVDYRVTTHSLDRVVMKGVSKIAKMSGAGLAIALLSTQYPLITLFPLRIRMKKKLYCACGEHDYSTADILITSADSDLDFVYYK